ncbi:hypothetical protein VTL71DRAFT_12891 [Oculimacula yallundae]|uniref:Uncharacterized protein n=1 Tax=Oculimacula yallundae TaxID=86028 RepID=A0ABR4CR20_9HELO
MSHLHFNLHSKTPSSEDTLLSSPQIDQQKQTTHEISKASRMQYNTNDQDTAVSTHDHHRYKREADPKRTSCHPDACVSDGLSVPCNTVVVFIGDVRPSRETTIWGATSEVFVPPDEKYHSSPSVPSTSN